METRQYHREYGDSVRMPEISAGPDSVSHCSANASGGRMKGKESRDYELIDWDGLDGSWAKPYIHAMRSWILGDSTIAKRWRAAMNANQPLP